MPNKKGRNKNAPSLEFNLPPFPTIANVTSGQTPKSKSKKRKRTQDDTPKAFTRLISRVQRLPTPKGLDDPPAPTSKKQKKGVELKIGDKETLRHFNRRVDASMGRKLRVESQPKKKQKKAKAAAQKGEDSEEEEDRKCKRRRNKGRAKSPDPWAALAGKREPTSFSDVAKAPPVLVGPKRVLHSRGIVDVEGVPKSAGSLAKREGLAAERRGVVEGYRKLMEEKRGKGLAEKEM